MTPYQRKIEGPIADAIMQRAAIYERIYQERRERAAT